MKAATALRQARRRAGLTQRELAELSKTPQSVIARIESGKVTPRVDTLDWLLRYCGEMLDAIPLEGSGVDRTLFIAPLKMTPAQRLDYATRSANNLRRLVAGLNRSG